MSSYTSLCTDPDLTPERTEAMVKEREKLAVWMLANSFSTGHGDTIDDLLRELDWQIKEMRERGTYLACRLHPNDEIL